MQKNQIVSVIIPVYNGEKTLPMAIGSLLEQTYHFWKCIIVNDGSTDGTKSYLDSISDERFRIIHLDKNMGRPFARQVALDNAEGQYLAMLDADDFYHPSKLERQVSTLEANPDVALVSSGMYSFGYNSQIECIRCNGNNSIIRYKKKIASPVAHAASMLRLEIAKKYQYNLKLKLAQDVDFLSKYLDGKSYIVTDDILYFYSEFDSVSITKILKGYYYSIVKSLKSFKEDPSFFSRYIAINMAKLAYGIFVYPILGINNVLKKRGVTPSKSEHSYFISLKNNLLNYL